MGLLQWLIKSLLVLLLKVKLFEKCKVYSSFKDSFQVDDLVNIIKNFNFRYVLLIF